MSGGVGICVPPAEYRPDFAEYGSTRLEEASCGFTSLVVREKYPALAMCAFLQTIVVRSPFKWKSPQSQS